MQLKAPKNLMRLILPGLFLTYIAATILAFLLHAQYFNDVLAKTFAEPSFPTQVAVNLPLLNRVALLIRLDQDNIDSLSASAVRKATTTASTPEESTAGGVPVNAPPGAPLEMTSPSSTLQINSTTSTTSAPRTRQP
ncbi:MAG TPA: hypothetical protein VJ579_01280 [Candidatus Paceibacterota bacterium]|nr:hypothetical protein [Candidatus Paceibacterota bacterium]